MYKRDFAILLLSAFAIYFSVQREGPVSFRQAWYVSLLQPRQDALFDVQKNDNRYHHLDDESLVEAHDVLCPPIVVRHLAGCI